MTGVANRPFDVIVIGGGAIGAAALHFLAKRGITNTLLLEGRSDYAQGATGLSGSLLRQFGALPFYADHSSEALRYYRERFAADTGSELSFSRTGALYFLRPDQLPLLEINRKKISERGGFPLEVLGAAEGRTRFPEFHWFDGDTAVYESEAGTLASGEVVQGWLGSARRRGAQTKTGVQVVGFGTHAGSVTEVRAEGGVVFEGRFIVFAAGPWTPCLLRMLGTEMPIFPRPLQINRFRYDTESRLEETPFFIDGATGTFGRPLPNGEFLGGRVLDETTDLARFRQPLNLRQAADAKRRLAQRMKSLRTASLIGGARALESYAVENRPVMRFSDPYGNLFVAAGWCCTGFALAPVFGDKIAQSIFERFETVMGNGKRGTTWISA